MPTGWRGGEERLTLLEESQAFAERKVEQLSAEMAEINRRIGELVARLARLEARLEEKSSGERESGEEE